MSDERCKANLIGISAGCDALHLFAFPAEAATNYWPSLSSWNLGSDNISLISGGTAFDLAGSNPSNKGVAMGSVSLPAGKSYRLTGKFSFARRGTTASAIFLFFLQMVMKLLFGRVQ